MFSSWAVEWCSCRVLVLAGFCDMKTETQINHIRFYQKIINFRMKLFKHKTQIKLTSRFACACVHVKCPGGGVTMQDMELI